MPVSLVRLVPLTLVDELISLAVDKGGDFAEIFIEHSRLNSVALEEHKIRSATHGVSLGVGVRVVVGTEVGYAYSDDLEPAALREAARVAAAIARAGRSSAPVPVSRRSVPDRYPVDVSPDEILPRAKVELLLRGDAAGHGMDARVTQILEASSTSPRRLSSPPPRARSSKTTR